MTSIPETSGIYRIICVPTGKFYIGSSVQLRSRWSQHLYDFRNSIHKNPHLQSAWNKHGEQCFVFEVLELTLPDFQLEREQYWLDKLQPFGKKGFNINREANKPTNSPETREKIRQAVLGHTLCPESRAKISASKTGHTYTPGIYASRMKTLIVTAPDGTEHMVTGVRQFCREHDLDISTLMRVAKGEYSQHKGWKARFSGNEFQKFMPHEVSSDERSERASSQKKTLIVIDPNGVEYTVHGISQFARQHGLDRYHLVEVAQGKRNHHRGWKARFPD